MFRKRFADNAFLILVVMATTAGDQEGSCFFDGWIFDGRISALDLRFRSLFAGAVLCSAFVRQARTEQEDAKSREDHESRQQSFLSEFMRHHLILKGSE